jgi:hypothetical protein
MQLVRAPALQYVIPTFHSLPTGLCDLCATDSGHRPAAMLNDRLRHYSQVDPKQKKVTDLLRRVMEW